MSEGSSKLTSKERSNRIWLLWLGFPSALLSIAWLILFPDDRSAFNLFSGIAAATVGTLVFISNYDEFIQTHLWTASRWALSVAGFMLLIQVFPVVGSLDLLASLDLTVGLTIIVAVFHTALAISRWRS